MPVQILEKKFDNVVTNVGDMRLCLENAFNTRPSNWFMLNVKCKLVWLTIWPFLSPVF